MICPLGNDGTQVRRRADDVCDLVITPVAEEAGLRVHRSDRDPTPGHITAQILKGILDARVVVADLTGQNANVFYELAFAQSFAEPVIMLADTADALPFDTRNDRVIEIPDADGSISARDCDRAKARLKAALETVTAEGYEPDSLMRDIAARAVLAQLAPTEAIAAELAALRAAVETFGRRLPSTSSRGAQARAEHGILTRMADALMDRGYITQDDLGGLWEFETSSEFGDWLYALMDRHEELFRGVPYNRPRPSD